MGGIEYLKAWLRELETELGIYKEGIKKLERKQQELVEFSFELQKHLQGLTSQTKVSKRENHIGRKMPREAKIENK